MSNEDLEFINIFADSSIYTTFDELLAATLAANETAANDLLYSLGIQ